MGDCFVVCLFRTAFDEPMEVCKGEQVAWGRHANILAAGAARRETVDLSQAVFVDDVENIFIFDPVSVKEALVDAVGVVAGANGALGSALFPHSMAQNVPTQVVLPVASGPGARTSIRYAKKVMRNLRMEARYLDLCMAANGDLAGERPRRPAAISVGHGREQKLLTEKIAHKFRRSVFLSFVYQFAFSAVEAFLVNGDDGENFDKSCVARSRKAFREQSCVAVEVAEGTGYIHKNKEMFMKSIGICKHAVELRVRRPKWLQMMLLHPESHIQPFGALFGHCYIGGMAPTDSHGRLTAVASPWLVQFYNDLWALREYDDAAEFVCAVDGRFRLLFLS